MSTEIGFQTKLHLPYDQVLSKTVDALKAEGFGVLTEIDVQTTFKQKLDVDFQSYKILGACNPSLSHRALSSNVDVGLLLPCNVTVYQDGDDVVVTAIDPIIMLGVLKDDPVVSAVAVEARAKLQRVIGSLEAKEYAF